MTSLRMRPTTFASGDVSTWLQCFCLRAAANEWKVDGLPKLLPPFLEGQALAVCQQMGEDDRKRLDKIQAALLSAFRSTPQLAMAAFQTRSLQHGESVEEFAYHLRRLLSDAMPDKKDETSLNGVCVKGGTERNGPPFVYLLMCPINHRRAHERLQRIVVRRLVHMS